MIAASRHRDPKARLRVLHVIEDLEHGGAERVVIQLARGLAAERFEVTVCCLTRKGRMAAELAECNIPVLVMHKRPGIDWALLPRLAALMRELAADIVHCHVFTANLWGRLAAMRAGVPVIITHEHSSFTLADWRRRGLERLLIHKTSRLIAVSEELRRRLITEADLPATRLITIHNGIDFGAPAQARVQERLRQELRLERFDPLLGTVGRLEHRKNYPILLQAFRMVQAQHPGAGLLFVGAGPEEAKLKELARQLGIAREVVFAGYRKEVAELLGLMQVFCLPSQTEGISMAILEAMAAGVPVVATHVGGNAEIIPTREVGILVPPGEVQALALALDETLRSPEQARQRAQLGQERVRNHFSQAGMIRQIEELYVACWQRVRKQGAADVPWRMTLL